MTLLASFEIPFISLDPGLICTAYVMWIHNTPYLADDVKPPTDASLDDRIKKIHDYFTTENFEDSLCLCVTEEQHIKPHWRDGQRVQTDPMSIYRLGKADAAATLNFERVVRYSPQAWKKGLGIALTAKPTKVDVERIFKAHRIEVGARLMSEICKNEHRRDAALIGVWHLANEKFRGSAG